MRNTLLLLFITVLQAYAYDTYSQNTKLTLNLNNVTVADVLEEIQNNSEFYFLFNAKLVDVEREVSISMKDKKISEILTSLFSGTEVKYLVYDRQIILTPSDITALSTAIQQQLKITGTVIDKKGNPLPGANVVVTGTTQGTTTDIAGKYSIEVPQGARSLTFSFVGMEPQEITIGTLTQINVTMTESAVGLEEVVVTALGIERSVKALTYTIQKVPGTEVIKVLESNPMNALEGKVAGLTVGRSTAMGGSVRVTLRGLKSLQGNNQPLYVVDGLPIMSYSNSSTAMGGLFSFDFGDGISNLNPNDIESINVLKGASAAALYGSSASNGVILITTKKGENGRLKVEFSSSTTFNNVVSTPKFQNSYGETAPNAQESWGPKITNAPDNISPFFQTGYTTQNSVAFSSATDNLSNYFSYSNTQGKGIIDNHYLGKHSLTFKQSARFFNNKLKLDAHLSYAKDNNKNAPALGLQVSPIVSLYLLPIGFNMTPYKDDYTIYDPNRNMMSQNWPWISNFSQNPYWIRRKMLYGNRRDRMMASISVKYDFTSWLNLQVRGSVDRINDLRDIKYYAGTYPFTGSINGFYNRTESVNNGYYGDAILSFAKSIGKIGINTMMGAVIEEGRSFGTFAYSIGLGIPNIFTESNFTLGSSFSDYDAKSFKAGVFGSLSLSYSDWLFFDASGRNDWSSALSFTPNYSYFYPSAGLSVILTNALELPEVISFLKLKGSYAVVGNSVPAYVTNPYSTLTLGSVVFNTVQPFTDLEPEMTNSMEFGTEFRLFKDRLNVDVTYYKTNTINQFFTIAVPPGTGYSARYINGGNIENKGLEATIGYNMISKSDFTWNSSINYSINRNVILELADGVDVFYNTRDVMGFISLLKVNGSYGDIYGSTLKRDDQGRVLISAINGAPLKDDNASYLGNPNPKFKMGWNNSFTFKRFSMSFLINGSFGGKVLSLTEAELDYNGVSQRSGVARDNGGVAVNGVVEGTGTPVTNVDAMLWYKTVGGKQTSAESEYIYDATVVGLREVSFGYSLPSTLTKGYIKGAKLSLVGRNLAYLYKKAPFDPETAFGAGNSYQGLEYFNLPATRGIGFNLNITF